MTKRQNTISKPILMRVLIAICVFAFVLSATLIVIKQTSADSKVDLAPEYFVGETFEIPSSTVNVNGTEVDATAVLYYPSGKAVSSNKVTFDEFGKYTLEYRVTKEGKLYTETYELIVNQKAYDGGLNASAVYSQDQEGLVAKFSAGGVIKFNKLYDLSKLTARDNLIKVLPLPQEKGVADCKTLVFTFTDAYDAENYLNVRFFAQDGVGGAYALAISNSYVSVSYPGAPYTGLDGSGNIHKGNNYGRPIRMSFYGVPGYEIDPAACPITGKDYGMVQLDYAGRTISASSNIATYGGTVAEFDNKNFFVNTWKGFTTGEVFISVKMENLDSSATNASFLIKELAGQPLTSETSVVDTIAPTINVDFDGYAQENLPKGVKNQAYKVFDVTAKDNIDFYPEVSVTAYKNYFTPALRKVYQVVDGAFTPDSAGSYVIEYKAKDVYGNLSTKAVSVMVVDQPSQITISAQDILDAVQGEFFTIPQAVALGDEAFGKISVQSKLYFGEKELAVENGRYRPLNAGEYKVVYTAVDYAGTVATLEKTFTVAVNEGVIFLDSIANLMPKYLVDGNEYTLPNLNAYVFSANGYEVKESAIKVDGVDLTSKTFIPSVEQNGQIVNIIYYYGDVEVEFNIQCVKALDDEYNLDMTKYFIADENSQVEATDDEIKLNFLTSNAKVDFANSLISNNLSVVFSIDEDNANFTKVVYTLTDTQNPEKKVEVSFTNQTSNIGLSVNGGTTETVDGGFNGKRIKFDFVDGIYVKMNKSSATSTTAIMYEIKSFTDGTAFTGFTNNMAYLTISVEGVTGGAVVNMVTINGNYMNNSIADPAKPRIAFNGELAYEQTKGSVVTIPSAVGVDVLQGKLPVTVSIRFNGQYMRAEDGTLLKNADASVAYKVAFVEYGEYSIIYESVDLFGNSGKTTKKVKVYDEIAPVITLKDSIKETAKVGDEIEIPTATATDNISADMKVYVTVVYPNSSYKFVTGESFTATMAGKYVVKYFAYDASGNLGVAEFTIIVK